VVDANPERMVKDQNLKDKVREKLDENTPFKHSQWKRLEIEEKGKKKYVTKILETTLAKQKFISIFEQQVDEFISHVDDQIRTLKDKLPPHNVIVQMDFAENYSCKSLEEIQSAYFNQTSVTLHPVVVYQ
jgi:CDP-diacylglycerol pyrophosphatase